MSFHWVLFLHQGPGFLRARRQGQGVFVGNFFAGLPVSGGIGAPHRLVILAGLVEAVGGNEVGENGVRDFCRIVSLPVQGEGELVTGAQDQDFVRCQARVAPFVENLITA